MLYETKDIDPKITVERAKSFLNKIKCYPVYTESQNTKGVYTGYLDGGNWGLSSNGKGLSSDLCKASAYGEFLERLQNLQYGLAFHVLDKTPNKPGFFYLWPDERDIYVWESLDENPYLQKDLQNLWMKSNSTTSAPDLYDLSYMISRYFQTDVMTSVPFYDVFNKCQRNFPIEILSLINGSTGQCAGNNPEEALVQGLSEILERWCEKQVLSQRLTPPEIPFSYIQQKTPDLYDIIQLYLKKDSNRFSIKVYDLSLGQGFPVIGLIIFDKRNLGYRIQSGSHPLFRIALERCLTELEQGLELNNKQFDCITFNSWTLKNSIIGSTIESQTAQARDGMGTLPDEWIANDPNWEFIPWPDFTEYSNIQGLKYLLDIFNQKHIPLFIRDTTISDLYTYTIYAPGISYALRRIMNDQIGLSQLYWIGRLDSEWENCSNDEKIYMLNYIKKFGIHELGPRTTSTPSYIIATAIAMEMNDLEAAKSFIKQSYATDVRSKLIEKEIDLMIEGFDENSRNKCLLNFFTDEDIEYLDKYWRQGNILESLYQEEAVSATYMTLDIDSLTITKSLLDNEMRKYFPKNQLQIFSWIQNLIED